MAKTVIDELVTLIGLKMSPGTRRAISGFNNGLRKLTKGAFLAGTSLESAAGGLSIFSGFAAHSLANQERLAKTLNMNVENLQAFQFAAKESGASAGDMNSALINLTKVMNPVIPGQYSRELLLLGERLKNDLTGKTKSAGAVLLDLSKILKTLTPEQQLNIAGQLGLEKLLPLLRKGQIGIAQLLLTARKVGAVIPEKDVQRIVKVDQDFVKLKATVAGFKFEGIAKLSPIIDNILIGIQSWIAANQTLIFTLSSTVLSGVSKGFGLFVKALSKINSIITSTFPSLKDFSSKLNGVNIIAGITAAGLGLLSLKLSFLGLRMTGAVSGIKILKSSLLGLVGLIGIEGTLVIGITLLVAALGKLKNVSQFKGASGINKALGLGTTPQNFLSNKLPGNPFKQLSVLGRQQEVSSVANNTSAQSNVTHNTTINVNGAGDPKAVADHVGSLFGHGQLSLNQSASLTNPGFNRPAIG